MSRLPNTASSPVRDLPAVTDEAAEADQARGDRLWIGIDGPNDISLRLVGLALDASKGLGPLTLTGPQPHSDLSAYAHVLLNLLQRQSTLSVSGEEAEQARRIVDPVLQAWAQDAVPMLEYPAGTAGPPPLEETAGSTRR